MAISGNLILVLQQIINQGHDESNLDHLIAEYLLRNLYRDDLTISTISTECHISKASVTRFSQSLGYQGFSDLKNAYELIELGKDEMKIDLIALNKNTEKNPLIKKRTNSLQKEFDQVGKDIDQFNQEIDLEQIEKLCDLIHEVDEVHIYATLIPGSLGNTLQNMLLNAGKFATCYPTTHQQYEDSQRLKENDVALFISLEGSHVMTRELTMSIINSKATTVLITQNPEMKLGSLFDQIIQLGDHNLERSGKYKLLIFIEYLTHFYFNKYGQ